MKRNVAYRRLRTAALLLAAALLAAAPAAGADKGMMEMLKEVAKEQGVIGVADYDAQGSLLLPVDYREWVFVGATVTPNDMNGGKAAFPEFHHVYIDPGSYKQS